MEYTRAITVKVEIDTNKQTIERVYQPMEHESHAEFAARVWDQLTELLEIVNR